ncbi:MAG: hypothetical protein CMH57_12635 [Myxococcales bacterium]|nr:hypothetical protein [Myxococcales bacterium]
MPRHHRFKLLHAATSSALAAAMMLTGCAHGPDSPPASLPSAESPAETDASRNAEVVRLNTQWTDFKGALTQKEAPWTLTLSDTAAALAESRLVDEDMERLQRLYARRGQTSVFFYKGRLTRAGQRARQLAQSAWTHGVERPERWPDQLPQHLTRHQALHQEIQDAIDAPLPLGDVERMRRLGELKAELLSPQALQQLTRIQTLQARARTAAARIDGALVSAVWQLARATRGPVLNRWEKPIPLPEGLYTAPERSLDGVAPHHEDYRLLTEAYRFYWELHTRRALKPLPPGLRLGVKAEREHAELPFLRDRLEAEGFLPDTPLHPTVTGALAYAARKKAIKNGDPLPPRVDEDDGSDAPEQDIDPSLGSEEGAPSSAEQEDAPVIDVYADPDEASHTEDDDNTASTEAEAVDALGEPIADPSTFVLDKALQHQLLAFQYTRGLELTGELDEATYQALNVPTEKLLRRIELGLARWHASPTRVRDRYVRVAINQFQVQLVSDGRVRERYDAVMGRPGRQTPRLNGTITHLVLYPWWWGTRNAPSATPPGPENPLGLLVLKIDPANYLVYLHGTNAPELLNEAYRYYSSGCVRMNDPTDLAGILLDEDPAPETSADLERLMKREETMVVQLAERVPVIMEYNTTYVHPDTGHTHFTHDAYRNDRHFMPRLRHDAPLASTWRR